MVRWRNASPFQILLKLKAPEYGADHQEVGVMTSDFSVAASYFGAFLLFHFLVVMPFSYFCLFSGQPITSIDESELILWSVQKGRCS